MNTATPVFECPFGIFFPLPYLGLFHCLHHSIQIPLGSTFHKPNNKEKIQQHNTEEEYRRFPKRFVVIVLCIVYKKDDQNRKKKRKKKEEGLQWNSWPWEIACQKTIFIVVIFLKNYYKSHIYFILFIHNEEIPWSSQY